MKAPAPRDHFEFLMSPVYDSTRLDHPAHVADLRKSGLTVETTRMQKFTDVPPDMIDLLLGFPTSFVVEHKHADGTTSKETRHRVTSAYLLPFSDPRGGWMNHIRMKVFPAIATKRGTVKYLQPRHSGVRIYFPLATLDRVRHSDAPLYIVEGEKKSLAVAQLGLPAIGICGIEGWHVAGSRELLPDFAHVPLAGRRIRLLPDGDWQTNADVRRGALRFARALEVRGAATELVQLPAEAA